eukprot:TRINITY_DN4105_c0_g2_i1.p1 TRINITY_DN4105_c0_g2~~TRINITY_DN4105_c0_g2_i1.p1  ORF type:complete len:110 (-),score=3.95 TRINITY_DN4105_c0_g2_i1:385-714(-)
MRALEFAQTNDQQAKRFLLTLTAVCLAVAILSCTILFRHLSSPCKLCSLYREEEVLFPDGCHCCRLRNVTLEQLRAVRPDLISAIVEEYMENFLPPIPKQEDEKWLSKS